MTRDFAEALRSYAPVTEDQARLLSFLRDHRDRLAQMSFDEIARAVGVSQPTVTRMVRQLGYANAHELRVAAALDMPGRLHPEQVRRGAELIRSGDDLYVFAPEILDRTMRDLFKHVFPKSKRLFHPIEFRVAAGGSAGLTERNELAGESRTRSF